VVRALADELDAWLEATDDPWRHTPAQGRHP